MTQNSFNVVDQRCIPVAGHGLVSVRAALSDTSLAALGGTAVEKIVVFKFLLAVAQAACTPRDTAEWAHLGVQGLRVAVLDYLERWHDSFDLYGDRPFLQMPAVKSAELKEYGHVLPEVASGNTTVLTQWQYDRPLSNADKTMLLLMNMSCCFGGKRTDKSIVLSPGCVKSSSAKCGPALCSYGLLHTFLTGASILETVWLNMLTQEDIAGRPVFTEGLGVPPWEAMPQGEICPTAEKLKHSLMGRLVPMARFCLLEEAGLRFVEGLQHPDYQQGYVDPSASIQEGGKKVRMLWADPARRPWRSLTALLGFMAGFSENNSFECAHLRVGLPRLATGGVTGFGIWSGGVKVSSNSGEQYLTGTDDMVESEFGLDTKTVYNENWFGLLQAKMMQFDEISKNLYGSIMGYYREFTDDSAETHARTAQHLYWQLAEQCFQDLMDACMFVTHAASVVAAAPNDTAVTEAAEVEAAEVEAVERGKLLNVMQRVVLAADTAFNMVCPQTTSRQIQAWAKCRPRLGRFLSDDASDKPVSAKKDVPHGRNKKSN